MWWSGCAELVDPAGAVSPAVWAVFDVSDVGAGAVAVVAVIGCFGIEGFDGAVELPDFLIQKWLPSSFLSCCVWLGDFFAISSPRCLKVGSVFILIIPIIILVRQILFCEIQQLRTSFVC
ncbi:hypothetical protein Ancab_001657 [Ancistrocladus abbreviatus]